MARRTARITILGLALILAAGCGARLPEYGRVPDFSLTDRTGRPVALRDLGGHIWVVDFIFTHCAGTCPTMTTAMAEIQGELADIAPLRLVSISVDPDADTPEVLTEYAKRAGAKSDRWLFLTGDSVAIQLLAKNGFKLPTAANGTEAQPAGKPAEVIESAGSSSATVAPFIASGEEEAIIHSQKFVLVDQSGMIRGYYNGLDRAGIEQLKSDARSLARSL